MCTIIQNCNLLVECKEVDGRKGKNWQIKEYVNNLTHQYRPVRTFAIKTLLYNILSTVPFKVVPPTGDTPFPTFLPLLECFLNRNFCDVAQLSYRIFLNLRMSKNKPNFFNSSPTSTEGALRLLNAPSCRFWQQTAIYQTNSLCTCSVQRM